MSENRAGRDAAYAIASDLLAGQGPLAWTSLGCWSASGAGTAGYVEACRELARRHGEAAGLGPGSQVLDLGCGRGASLAFWPEVFAVGGVTAVERQADCVRLIREQAPARLRDIRQACFDEPLALPAGIFDAVLSVDAAYHARSLDAFAAVSSQALAPGGRLAFSTLVSSDSWRVLPAWRRSLLLAPLALAGIPAASIATSAELSACLARHGFGEVALQCLDTEVLGGFADFVPRRARELGRWQRLGPDWRKIALTARLCRRLLRDGQLHYNLVSATRLAGHGV